MRKLICALIGVAALVASATTYIQTSSTGTAPWKPVKDSVSQAHLADSARHAPPSAYADSSRVSGLADSAKRAGWAPLDSGRVRGIVGDTATTLRTYIGSASTTGNAATATKLATARTITTSGDVTGTPTAFDGTANITIPTTLPTLLTAGSAGSATAVPTLTWDAKGRLTAVGSAAISIPHTQINDWSTATSSFLTANQPISLTGAVTGSGTTSIATSFANTHLAGINQDLATTSSPVFANNIIAQNSISYGSTGENGRFTIHNPSGSETVDVSNAFDVYLRGYRPTGYAAVGILGVTTRTGSGTADVDVLQWNPTGVGITGILNVTGLITANGGISGNLTGTASNASALGGVAAAGYGTLAQDTAIAKKVASDTATVLRTGISSAITISEAYATARISDSLTANARGWITSSGSITGNASTATQLATSRTISATGDGAWSTSFDGSANVTGKLTLATLLTAGSAGSATSVPTLTWDAKGRLTAVGSAAISIPHTQINDWSTATSSFLTANQPISLTGAVTGSGTTSIATSFANTHLAGINQDLATTSSPVFANNIIAQNSISYGSTGENGRFTIHNPSGSETVDASNAFDVYLRGYRPTGYAAVGILGVTTRTGSGTADVDVLQWTPTGVGITGILNVTGLITANGGISGNLTGHASLDIPLTGSSAITGSLISSNASNLGLASLPWGSVYGTTLYENGTALASKYLSTTYSGSLSLYGLTLNNGGLSVQGVSSFTNKVTITDDLTANRIKSWTITPRSTDSYALGGTTLYWYGTYTNRLFCAIGLNAPSTATDVGIAGQIVFGSSYIYVCTATNTWKRAALTTW